MSEYDEARESANLLFDIRRSARYHDLRSCFFERWHRITNLFMILLAGTVIMDLAGYSPPLWIKVFAVVGATLSAFDLLVGFSRQADLHRDFKRRFVALERDILNGLNFIKARSARLEIESEEPPIYRSLDLICHNAQCLAEGYRPDLHPDEFEHMSWFRRLTAQLFHWPNVASPHFSPSD